MSLALSSLIETSRLKTSQQTFASGHVSKNKNLVRAGPLLRNSAKVRASKTRRVRRMAVMVSNVRQRQIANFCAVPNRWQHF